MTSRGSYRIRWANVSHGNGYSVSIQRMCIAERRNWLCWWPVKNSEWRAIPAHALADIEVDKELRARLREPLIVH
jgi:hypothetical protein